MQWLERDDVKVRGHEAVHVGCGGSAASEGRVLLREIAMEEFDPIPLGEPIKLRAAVCERCGAILAVVSVVRP
jgi:hypothetical protein